MPPRTSPKTLRELAAILEAELIGDGDFEVADVAHPRMAASGHVLALATDDGSYAALGETKARAAVVEKERQIDLNHFAGGLRVARGRVALARLLEIFARPPHAEPGIHPQAVVDDSASLGGNVSVGPLTYVGPRARVGDGTVVLSNVTIGADTVIGPDCLIKPGARIGERCVLGARVIVQMNAAIGVDGFGYVTPEPGSVESARKTGEIGGVNTEIIKVNTIGNVVVEDDVEIGANTAIDSATLGRTRIGRGTKIDNLVQIGHNCDVGANCLIAGQAGLAGSVKLGDRVVLAGGVGVADHRTIGNDAIILSGSGVGQDVPPREIWGGYPAARRDQKLEELMNIARVKRLIRDVRELKESVAALRK